MTRTPASGNAQAMTPACWPIPPQPNAYFDEVNKRLGATVKFTVVAGNDYKAKLAATTAGGNVPDLTVVTQWDQPARMSEAVGTLFADLTEHLRATRSGATPTSPISRPRRGAWAVKG